MFDIPILILARAGSKRIVNKNIIDFCGKPLISYAIEKAKSVSRKVYVSTNCEKISRISENYGAKIINRPDHLSEDKSKSIDGVKHFLNTTSYNHVFLLQATSPLITPDQMKKGIEKYQQGKYNSVISATQEKIYIWDKDYNPINFDLLNRNRTQEHQSVFVENGGFYITSRQSIIDNNSLFNLPIAFEVIPKKHSIDIDNYEDLEFAKTIYRAYRG